MLALAPAYVGLAFLAAVDWFFVDVHLGALALLPLLVIAYFGGPALASVTAIFAAIGFAYLDHDVPSLAHRISFNIQTDAVVLMFSFLVAILTAERFKRASTTNVLLNASLAQVRKSAEQDALTGLPNRAAFGARLDQALRVSEATGASFAIVFADLDGFKNVNDLYGHDAGDRLLQMVALRMQSVMRSADMLCRIGGDEFAALLDNMSGLGEAEALVQKIKTCVELPFIDGNERYTIGVTIGIGMYPKDGTDASTILRAADRHMYVQKRAREVAGRPDPLQHHALGEPPKRREVS